MEKEELKQYYCSNCDKYFDEPAKFKEDRTPYGEKSNDSWKEELEGCPICHEGLKVVYLCPRCELHYDNVEYYPYAEEYMCDDCYEEMMDNGELVKNEMECVINDGIQRGLDYEEE